MSINLIESKRVSQKSVRGTLVSIAIHASVITVAAYATANAGEASTRFVADTVHLVYTANPKVERRQSAPARRVAHSPVPQLPAKPPLVLEFPVAIPEAISPAAPIAPVTHAGSLFGSSVAGDTAAVGVSAAGDGGEPLFASQVEKPALPRSGNPIPRYPALLESSRVAGVVLVQFVVDTLGRADMSTFRVVQASNELFARSLESTLPKWRFYSAEAGGHRVRQVVQLPLRFVAPQH
ncbi:MAG: energy transducer TonB [Gemmatimonadaceae bacterium]